MRNLLLVIFILCTALATASIVKPTISFDGDLAKIDIIKNGRTEYYYLSSGTPLYALLMKSLNPGIEIKEIKSNSATWGKYFKDDMRYRKEIKEIVLSVKK